MGEMKTHCPIYSMKIFDRIDLIFDTHSTVQAGQTFYTLSLYIDVVLTLSIQYLQIDVYNAHGENV